MQVKQGQEDKAKKQVIMECESLWMWPRCCCLWRHVRVRLAMCAAMRRPLCSDSSLICGECVVCDCVV